MRYDSYVCDMTHVHVCRNTPPWRTWKVASVVASIRERIETLMAPATQMSDVSPQDTQFLQGIATPSPAPTPTRWGDPDPDKFLAWQQSVRHVSHIYTEPYWNIDMKGCIYVFHTSLWTVFVQVFTYISIRTIYVYIFERYSGVMCVVYVYLCVHVFINIQIHPYG